MGEAQSLTPALEGKYSRTCNGKLIESGSFIQGSKTGEWITYSRKGQMIRKFNYQDGKLDGAVELFYADGTPKLKAFFADELPVSNWNYYTSKGKLWMC